MSKKTIHIEAVPTEHKGCPPSFRVINVDCKHTHELPISYLNDPPNVQKVAEDSLLIKDEQGSMTIQVGRLYTATWMEEVVIPLLRRCQERLERVVRLIRDSKIRCTPGEDEEPVVWDI